MFIQTWDTCSQIFASGIDELSAIEIIAALFPPTSRSENETIAYVQQQLCEEQRLRELFHFPNGTVANDVHDELCNLTSDQFYSFAELFVQDFSWTKFTSEV